MEDKELRKLIDSRAKQRRLEPGLKQPYVAEKMGVTASSFRVIPIPSARRFNSLRDYRKPVK